MSEIRPQELRLEDIPVVREFPDVFPEELPGPPPVIVCHRSCSRQPAYINTSIQNGAIRIERVVCTAARVVGQESYSS